MRMLIGQLEQIGGQLSGIGQLQPVRRPCGGRRRLPAAAAAAALAVSLRGGVVGGGIGGGWRERCIEVS